MRMNKIFVLSLHRTGTQSVHDLFIRLGLSAVHWPAVVDGIDYQSQVIGREDDLGFVADLLTPVFEQVTAVSDVPVPVLYRELEAQYDNARFIAIRRKPHECCNPCVGTLATVRWILTRRCNIFG